MNTHHKIVVLPIGSLEEKETILYREFETPAEAEARAITWLEYCPNDILTLVAVKTATCSHCGKRVEENIGAVLHKWIHTGGYYACLPEGATKATPGKVKT